MNEVGLLNLRKAIENSGLQNKILIWGASDKSDCILEMIKKWGYDICGFIDSNHDNIKEYKGYKVYGRELLDTDVWFVYVALKANYEDVISTFNRLGYQEFINYWYPRRLVVLDGTENYQDLYGNQLVTYNDKPINVCLRDGGKVIIKSKRLDNENRIASEGNSYISIGENVCIKKDSIISSTNGKVEIGANCKFESNLMIRVSSGGMVLINERCTIQRYGVLVASFNAKIVLGSDCMLSYFVLIRAGNSHNMIDLDTRCHLDDNSLRDVILGEHVWVGMRVTLINGVRIGSGSTIGANSFICKKRFKSNCCVAGNPPKVLREKTAWIRDGVSIKKDMEEYELYIYDDCD